MAGFIPQHNSVNGPRGLRRGDSAVGIFHKVELKTIKNLALGEQSHAYLTLVHLLEASHNKRFHALMSKFLPEWRDCKNQLRHAPIFI